MRWKFYFAKFDVLFYSMAKFGIRFNKSPTTEHNIVFPTHVSYYGTNDGGNARNVNQKNNPMGERRDNDIRGCDTVHSSVSRDLPERRRGRIFTIRLPRFVNCQHTSYTFLVST